MFLVSLLLFAFILGGLGMLKLPRRKKSWTFLRFQNGSELVLPITQDGKCGYCHYPMTKDRHGEWYCFWCEKGLQEIGYAEFLPER
jgi:hypothetical protein